jgi:hypothetical protein
MRLSNVDVAARLDEVADTASFAAARASASPTII